MAQNQIKSYNTVQLHRQLFRNKVANRFMVGAAVFLVFIGFLWGGKYIGLTDYSDKLSSVISFNKPTPVERETDAGSEASAPVDGGQGGSSSDPSASGGTGGGGASGTSGSSGSSSGGGGGSRPSATPAAPAPAPAGSACGNASIPAAACTALLAIEQNGAKNNPYVAMDQGQLAQLPDGSTIVINKSTWAPVNDSQANVDFTITIQGQPYNASLAMQNNGGTWQAVNFALR